MEPFTPKSKHGPEKIRQLRIMGELRKRGWFVKQTHGNEFQCGFPDIFACHIRYGSRWIEVKNPTGSRLEESQEKSFHAMADRKTGVWILTDSHDFELNKLLQPANWYQFLDAFKVVTRTRDRNKEPWEKKQRLASRGPEREIQEDLKSELTGNGWYVMETHGNIFQYGFPDLYACHREYGARWIEVKNPTGYVFTPAQLEVFPQFQANGCGIWVLTSKDEIPKLFSSPNWWTYLDAFKL
jgi:hypothetical protein